MRDIKITLASVDNRVGANGVTRFRGGSVIQSVTVSTTVTMPSLGFSVPWALSPRRLLYRIRSESSDPDN